MKDCPYLVLAVGLSNIQNWAILKVWLQTSYIILNKLNMVPSQVCNENTAKKENSQGNSSFKSLRDQTRNTAIIHVFEVGFNLEEDNQISNLRRAQQVLAPSISVNPYSKYPSHVHEESGDSTYNPTIVQQDLPEVRGTPIEIQIIKETPLSTPLDDGDMNIEVLPTQQFK